MTWVKKPMKIKPEQDLNFPRTTGVFNRQRYIFMNKKMMFRFLINKVKSLILLLLILLFSNFNNKDKSYVISSFGAKGDSATINTKSIQTVIEKCASDGGGTIIVPEGIFLTGALFFKPGVNLHIEKGGILKGTVNWQDHPLVETRWEGVEQKWTCALINVFNTSGFKLTGEGMIDGSGEEWIKCYPGRPDTVKQIKYPLPTDRVEYAKPRLIAIQNCFDVLVSGLNLKNQACWGLFALYSQHVTIENLTIRAQHNIPMSDGIDIDSGKDIVIKGCTIDVNDDCIAIKSGKDEDGRRVNKPSEDILVENCHFMYGHGGVSI